MDEINDQQVPSGAKINALENQGQENLKAQSKTLK